MSLNNRLNVILGIFIAIFIALFFRLFYLQVVRGEKLNKIAESNRTTLVYERAPRGVIFDRNSQILADNRPTFVVLFTPLDLDNDVLENLSSRLSKIFKLDYEILYNRLSSSIETSSPSVFHCWHAPQLPVHFICVWPHSLHAQITFVLFIEFFPMQLSPPAALLPSSKNPLPLPALPLESTPLP